MGKFSYKAVDKKGEHVTGTIEASDRKSAVLSLTNEGHLVTELVEKAKSSGSAVSLLQGFDLSKSLKLGGARVSSKDILAMTSQLGTALRAGLPLLNGLELIHQQQNKSGMKEMLADLINSVSSGKSLSEAMEKHEKIFSPLYLSMIRVGEAGGILDQTTSQLAGILTRDEKIKTNMKNASAYPIFVLLIGLASVVIIITWILPSILKTIQDTGALLPLPTRILLGISGFTKAVLTTATGWIVLAMIIAGIIYFFRWTKNQGRLQWDTFKLRIPILGSVLRTIAVGRFARTLGALTKGGVIILEALSVVRDTLGNELLGREIDIVADKVKRGEPLAEPLSVSGYFPPLLVQITSIGEETGKLDEMLLNAAETFDMEADAALNRFMAIFPAILILMLALVIGFIIVATLLPIVMMTLSGGAF
ncbi:MAG: type II secretion system F family protein [Sedimentisphaerales bacterium]|nr:type II secretion system F family protein [Sedimentisphaerales bacterium]